MTNYIGWTPPPGVAVVPPPVHPETVVSVLYSDGAFCEWDLRAGDLNWSCVGDGPAIVAYAVVRGYKEPPKAAREWWLTPSGFAYASHEVAGVNGEEMSKLIHVREVPDPSREVVAWAVVGVDGKPFALWISEDAAGGFVAEQGGGTVVRLTGVMP